MLESWTTRIRKTTDSFALIRDTICYTRDSNIWLVILNLRKPLIEYRSIKKNGFSERFIAWVGLLYWRISNRFVVDGHLIKAVAINCGVHQGCPLSALLYVLYVEPLAQILRNSWVRIPGSGRLENKCILYMDDMNILYNGFLSVAGIDRLVRKGLWPRAQQRNIPNPILWTMDGDRKDRTPHDYN